MSVVITGWRSEISKAFRALLQSATLHRGREETTIRGTVGSGVFPVDKERYLFCHGLLRSKTALEQTPEERAEGLLANLTSTVAHCDEIIARNPLARICVIGSESGYRGSYDGVYAAAKAALHHYVEHKRIRTMDQQLVAISPGIIEDAGMTMRREDIERLEQRRRCHPKGRFLLAAEVAAMAHFLLYHAPYVSGTVVRMHGGDVT